MKIPFIAGLLILLNSLNFSQENSHPDSLLPGKLEMPFLDRFWNNVLEDNLSEVNEAELSDELESLSAHPVDINTAALEELLAIPFLNYQDAKSIIDYRNKSGRFFSTNEIRQIRELPNSLINNILPYLTASIPEVISATSITLRANPDFSTVPTVDFRTRLQGNSLYNKDLTAGTYTGSPIRLYNRLKVNAKDRYQLGIILEKDAGEKSFTDFNSFHLLVSSVKPFDAILLGDYNVEFGHGLALWNPYGFLKEGSPVSSMHMRSKNIKPYLSTDENSFLRGGAASFSFSSFSMSAFYSDNFRDANLDPLSGKITSFYTSGYHRTLRESQKKDRIKEVLFGGKAGYNFGNVFKAGVLYYQSQFDRQFLETSPLGLSGSRFHVIALSYELFLDQVFISGEAASSGRKSAIRSFLELPLTEPLSAIVLFRHYDSGFPSMHSFSSGTASGSARQETGIYGALNVKTPLGTLDIYYDQFRREKRYFPSNGNQFGLSFSAVPFKKLSLNLRYRNGEEEICDFSLPEEALSLRQIRSFKADVRCDFPGSLFLKLHGEVNRFLGPTAEHPEKGFVIFEEAGISKDFFSLSARVSYFKTDSYNSRIYLPEIDAPGSLTGYSLSGQGVKWSLNLRGRISKEFSVSIKYSETSVPQTNSYRSEETNNTLNLQLDVKF
ncbi:MAG TPA: helix-hairpin-helix domain-containing protein [Ignavibacteriales bacterium]|nr:helix-hairpin-helix domain-containing protein [Ignavibacteriales bacterium]